MSLDKVRYDAFISYRHCELDSFISENLHKKLESYKMPASVVRRIGAGKTKIERVFRDEAELPLSDNLSDPISEALDNSEFLIVICTPRLKESLWCRKEIETFVRTHDRKHVLLVLAEGEPEESFPDILMYEEVAARDENGNDITVKVDREPLAADCRGENNRQRLKALDNVVLKLCAAIFNLNYDDLKQRHRERRIRNRLIAMSAALAIVSVFAVMCLLFSVRISRQNKVISDKYAGAMATASAKLLSQGQRNDAIYAVRNVLPDDARGGYNKDAYYALVRAIAPYETQNCYFPTKSFKIPQDARGFSVSEDGEYALINCEGYFIVMDMAEDKQVARVESMYSDIALFSDTGVVYTDDDLQAIYLDPVTGDTSVLAQEGFDLYYVPAEKTVLVFSADAITGYAGLKERFKIDNPMDDPDYEVDDVFISGDGKYAAFSMSGYEGMECAVIDIPAGRLVKSVHLDDVFSATVCCDGEKLYVCCDDEGDMTGVVTSSILRTVELASDRETTCDIPGYGFYNMLAGDNGMLLVSDSLAYVLDGNGSISSTITGYMDAVCVIERDEGFVIIDALGRFFSDSVFSDVDRCYSLYGHDDDAMISAAVSSGDKLFIEYRDSGRMTVYSPDKTGYTAMADTGDAIPFDENPDADIDISDLEGIDEISVFGRALSADGKYIAVNSNDGTMYIFESSGGRKVKEIYDTGIVLMSGLFPYLKNAGVYIIENRVFDEDFNMISRLPDGALVATGRDGAGVVIESPYSLDTYYEISIMPYDEMIRKADGILKDYVPGSDVRDKYSIGQAGE